MYDLENISYDANFVQNLLYSAVAILLIYVARWFILKLLIRDQDDAIKVYRWRKNSTYIIVFIGIIVVGRIWYEGFGSIATFLGILSAGIAIALKDPRSGRSAQQFI